VVGSEGLFRTKFYIPRNHTRDILTHEPLSQTEIGRLYISGKKEEGDMRASAKVSTKSSSSIVGDGTLVVGDEILLSLSGGKFSALEDGTSDDDIDTVAATRLEWRPDVDFVNIHGLIHPRFPDPRDLELIERFSMLCMIEMKHKLSEFELTPEQPAHLQKFITWLDIQLKHAAKGEDQIFDSIKELTTINAGERLKIINKIREEVIGREASSPVELIFGLVENFKEICLGEMDPLNVMIQGTTLTEFYTLVDSKIDYREFFVVSGHSNPNLRVLEIGAGTGVSTQSALEGLSSTYGEKMYSRYW
jgi:hypothetical protein